MKNILMTVAAVMCCSMSLWAQHISEQQAKERVLKYMNNGTALAKAPTR